MIDKYTDRLEAPNISVKKGRGKAIPLQAWTGPEVSRRSRLQDFKTVGARRW